jgi:N-formylmaleamate deformylase
VATTEDDQAILDRAGFGARVRRGGQPALLVVDLSRGFTDPDSPVGSDLTAAVEATSSLIRVAHAGGIPVIFTTIQYQEGGRDGGVWLEKAPGLAALTTDSGWGEIDPRLPRRAEDPVIVKKGASAFFGTNLSAILSSMGINTLVVCGATTSGCVRASVVDGVQFGYRCLVPRECVGDRTTEPHAANLFDIDSKYGDVIGVAEARAYLEDPGASAQTEP